MSDAIPHTRTTVEKKKNDEKFKNNLFLQLKGKQKYGLNKPFI